MPEIRNITIIGAGLMGHGIAQVFAAKGYNVILVDLNDGLLVQAIKNIRSNLALMADNDIGAYKDIDPVISRIRSTTDMSEATTGAHFVVEAVSENLNLKQKVFHELDRLCVLLKLRQEQNSVTESWGPISGIHRT